MHVKKKEKKEASTCLKKVKRCPLVYLRLHDIAKIDCIKYNNMAATCIKFQLNVLYVRVCFYIYPPHHTFEPMCAQKCNYRARLFSRLNGENEDTYLAINNVCSLFLSLGSATEILYQFLFPIFSSCAHMRTIHISITG